MKKKIFSVLLVTALIATMVAGCGGKKKEVENTETIENSTISSEGIDISGSIGTAVSVELNTVDESTTEYKAIENYLSDSKATFEVYDISILDKDGTKVQPNGSVEITIKVSDKIKKAKGDAYVVFHSEGEAFKKIACAEKDGYVTFNANHFSTYSICKYDSTDETTSTTIDKIAQETIPAPTTENTDTTIVAQMTEVSTESNTDDAKENVTEPVEDKPQTESQTEAQTEPPYVEPETDAPEPETSVPTEAPTPEPATPAPTEPAVANNMPVPFYTVTTYDGLNGYFYPLKSTDYIGVPEMQAASDKASSLYGNSNGQIRYTFDDVGRVNFQYYFTKDTKPDFLK